MAAIVRLQRLAAVPREELSHNARKAVLSAFFRDFCGIAGGNSLHCCGERYENGNFSGQFLPRIRARALPAARGRIPGVAAFRINPRCGTLMRRAHYLEVLDGVGAQMSKKTMSVHCPVCNVSSPRDLSELAHPSGQSCLICGAFLSDYAWGELATVLLAVQQLSDHFRAGVSHAR